MTAKDIVDRETLEAWLTGWPLGDAILIAERAALRVGPVWFASNYGVFGLQDEMTFALPVLRALLTTGVARRFQQPLVRQAADAAADDAAHVAGYAGRSDDFDKVAAAPAADAAARAADASAARASGAAGSTAARSAAAGAADVAARAADAATEMWDQIRSDCLHLEDGQDIEKIGLWGGAGNSTQAAWDRTKTLWQPLGQTFTFWQYWYHSLLNGRPMNPELLRDIALISEDDWKLGPRTVAAAIERILEKVTLDGIIRENPYAWRISFDTTAGKFTASAIEQRNLGAIVASVRVSIVDFHKRCRAIRVGNFGQSVELAFAPVIKLLRADLKRYAESHLSLMKGIEAARAEMQAIGEMENFSGESYLTRFFQELQSHAEDICVAAPEIVEQLKAKEAVRYDLYTMERKRTMTMQTFGLHLDAEGMLKRVALDALRIITDDTATDAQKKDAWYFATAVLPRAARAYLATKPEDDGLRPKAAEASTAKRIVDAADAFAKLDKGKDALMENIPAALDWVQTIIDGLSNTPPPF